MTTNPKIPSTSAIQTRLIISRERATDLRTLLSKWRKAPHDERDDAAETVLELANHYLEGHGVELLWDPTQWETSNNDHIALYVDRGHTSKPTILYDPLEESWWIGPLDNWCQA